MAAGCTESQGYDEVENIVTLAAPKIFNNFPIFDENYRLALEKKILMHYYTREICEETVGLWKLRLATRMNEIMPYFNKLYDSELLKYEPFYDVDLTTQREMSGQKVGTNKEKSESETVSAGSKQNEVKNERDVSESTGVSDVSKTENERNNTGVESASNKVSESNNTTVEKKDSTTNIENSTNKVDSENNIHKVGDGSTTSDTVGTKNSTDAQTHWDLYSDTPQGTIENIAAGASDHNRYLTNAREMTDNDTYGDRTTDDTDTTNEYEETVSDDGATKSVGSVVRQNDGATTESNSGTRDNEVNTNTLRENVENGEINTERVIGRNGLSNEVGVNKENGIENKVENGSIMSEKVDTVNNLDSFTERVFGKRGGITYSKMLMELRESFLNIDMLVIEKLGDLFFGLW